MPGENRLGARIDERRTSKQPHECDSASAVSMIGKTVPEGASRTRDRTATAGLRRSESGRGRKRSSGAVQSHFTARPAGPAGASRAHKGAEMRRNKMSTVSGILRRPGLGGGEQVALGSMQRSSGAAAASLKVLSRMSGAADERQRRLLRSPPGVFVRQTSRSEHVCEARTLPPPSAPLRRSRSPCRYDSICRTCASVRPADGRRRAGVERRRVRRPGASRMAIGHLRSVRSSSTAAATLKAAGSRDDLQGGTQVYNGANRAGPVCLTG